MPLQLLDASLEILLHIVSAFLLVVLQHHALQQCLGELQLTNLVLQVLTYVAQELVVAVLLQLGSDVLGDLLAESLLVFHFTLTEHTVEELLIHLCRLEMTDLSNLVAEVCGQIFHLILLYLQKSCHLGIVVRISLLGVEGDDVTGFSTVEEFLLVFGLDIGRHHHTTLGCDTTFLGVTLFVELTQITGDGVITAEHLSLHELTSL